MGCPASVILLTHLKAVVITAVLKMSLFTNAVNAAQPDSLKGPEAILVSIFTVAWIAAMSKLTQLKRFMNG